MQTIGLMRIHDFPLAAEYAVPALADVTDGFCLLFHQTSPKIVERLTAHPKCLAHGMYVGRYHTGKTFLTGFQLVQEFSPSFIVCFDEDEIPPDRFAHEFGLFKEGSCESMAIRNFECWGDVDHIVADLCYMARPHCHVMRWAPDILTRKKWPIGSERSADFFSFYYRRPSFHCEYPLRHLAFMTPELRHRRIRRGLASSPRKHWHGEAIGRRAWPLHPHRTIPYDPDMTWEGFRIQGGARISKRRRGVVHV